MNLKSIFFMTMFLLPFILLAQQNPTEDNMISTKAVIKNIEKKSSGKKAKEIATVVFTTKKGDTIETMVELARIPFLGSFKSVGDEITVNYSEQNPALARTNTGQFLEKYGMYILIALGVILSVGTYIKAVKKSKRKE